MGPPAPRAEADSTEIKNAKPMKRITRIVTCITFTALLIGCGPQKDAERLVDQFIEQNAIEPTAIQDVTYLRIDSTKMISDSLIEAMQQRSHELFKEEIDYPVKSKGNKLYFIRMKFTYKGDTLRHTFYIDETLEHIVAFK
jgi:hypothetical protein